MKNLKVNPDKAAYQIALLACGTLGTTGLTLGKNIHADLSKAEESQPGVCSSLINIYAKCGDFTRAVSILDTMLASGQKDLDLSYVSL